MQEYHKFEECPICAGTSMTVNKIGDCSGHPFYKPPISREITWMLCGECGHSFREGYYTDEACEIIYSTTSDNRKVGHDLERQRIVSSRIVEKVLPYHSSGDWLDVGFGNGALLFAAQEYGFGPVGVDVRRDNVELMRGLGVEAYCQYMETLELDERFSVVSMADVLEHMPYPLEGLRTACKLLRQGGVLFVSMPNTETMIWRTMEHANQNPYWNEIEHYHNFSRSLLYAVLQGCGFTPMQYGVSERYRSCMEVIAVKN